MHMDVCLPIPNLGCQIVDASECVLLSPLWKSFAFALFVFQLHFLLLQFSVLHVVIIIGTNRVVIFFAT
jgi:hypothetical protein